MSTPVKELSISRFQSFYEWLQKTGRIKFASDLAKVAGVTRPVIGNAAHGKSVISKRVLNNILTHYEITHEDYLRRFTPKQELNSMVLEPSAKYNQTDIEYLIKIEEENNLMLKRLCKQFNVDLS